MLTRTATFAMGTRFELVLEGSDESRSMAAAEAAIEIIETADARYSRFRSDSLISRINREASASWVRVDPESFELLARCAAWNLATGGAFDIAVGAPMDRVRAHRGPGQAPWVGGFELDSAHASVRFTGPGTALDLGGIGKGYALDLAAQALREFGIECALLHGGTSSVIAIGAPPTLTAGWRVDLGPELGHAQANLRDRALSMSATRGSRTNRGHGSQRAHVIDPRDGTPLTGDSRSAVCAKSAAEAEAWSTALLVLASRDSEYSPALASVSIPGDVEYLLCDPLSAPLHRAGSAQSFVSNATPPQLVRSEARHG